jgi:hypothetical protein
MTFMLLIWHAVVGFQGLKGQPIRAIHHHTSADKEQTWLVESHAKPLVRGVAVV